MALFAGVVQSPATFQWGRCNLVQMSLSMLKTHQEVAKFVDLSFLEQKFSESVSVQSDLLGALHDRLDERRLV